MNNSIQTIISAELSNLLDGRRCEISVPQSDAVDEVAGLVIAGISDLLAEHAFHPHEDRALIPSDFCIVTMSEKLYGAVAETAKSRDLPICVSSEDHQEGYCLLLSSSEHRLEEKALITLNLE